MSKVHFLIRYFHNGNSNIEGIFTSKTKAKAKLDFYAKCCADEGWTVTTMVKLGLGLVTMITPPDRDVKSADTWQIMTADVD
jgi:hypothetical protein